MKTNKLLTILLLAAQLGGLPQASASPAEAAMTLTESMTSWYNRYIRSGTVQKQKAMDAGIETDPEKTKAADRVTANGGGLEADYSAIGSALKSVNPTDFTPEYLATKPLYIGREDKIMEAAGRLMDASKPNVPIVGEAGVGKTAFVRGLARYLHSNWRNIPGMGKPKVIEIDINSITAGTTYRGQMEKKVTNLIRDLKAEAAKMVPDENGVMVKQTLIVYMDELHQIMGAGRGSDGSTGLAEMLKPILTDEDLVTRIRWVGSTTRKEYKYLESDSAFQRRWGTPIDLNAPSLGEAVAMIMGNIERYQAYYGLRFNRETIEMFCQMALKYSTKFVLPDPAFNMMNRAGTRALMENVESVDVAKLKAKIGTLTSDMNLARSNGTPASKVDADKLAAEIEGLSRQMEQAQQSWRKGREKILEVRDRADVLEAELANLRKLHSEKVAATTDKLDHKVLLARIKENAELNEKIEILAGKVTAARLEQQKHYESLRENMPIITREQALAAAGNELGISPAVLARTDTETTRILQTELPRSVPGQTSAMREIGKSLGAGLRGLVLGGRPRAVITMIDSAKQLEESARAIDELVFGARNSSEVREAHLKTWVLDFSSPRYANFSVEMIAEEFKKRPHRVIAFMNVDAANPHVQRQIEEIITTGRLQTGNVVSPESLNFSDSILMMHLGRASNLDATVINGQPALRSEVIVGLYENEPQAASFVHALLQQSDTVAHLRSPNIRDLTLIVERRIKDLNESLKKTMSLEKGSINIKVLRRAGLRLAQLAGDVNNIDRVINEEILKPVNNMISLGKIKGGEDLTVRWDGSKLVID